MTNESPYWKEAKVERSKKILASLGFDLSTPMTDLEDSTMSSWFNASLKKFDVKSDKVWEKCYNEHQNRWGSIKSEKTFKSKLQKFFQTRSKS
jgi:hypothetical protein